MISESVEISTHTETLRSKIAGVIIKNNSEIDQSHARSIAGSAVEEMRAYRGGLKALTEDVLTDYGYKIALMQIEPAQERE